MLNNIATTRPHISSVQRPNDSNLVGNNNNADVIESKSSLKSSNRIIVMTYHLFSYSLFM